ncbi:hypothetical protein QQP08_024092 [Theobroma cacao]|nr:hypothetical protein QQP08_024092 [Theobroma cacao]
MLGTRAATFLEHRINSRNDGLVIPSPPFSVYLRYLSVFSFVWMFLMQATYGSFLMIRGRTRQSPKVLPFNPAKKKFINTNVRISFIFFNEIIEANVE